MKNDLNPVEQERRDQKLQLKKKQKSKKRDFNKISVEEPPLNSTTIEPPQQRLGPKSIFYDPEWNPYGEIPAKYSSKYPNLYYNLLKNKFHPNSKPFSDEESKLLANIKLPPGDPPRFYKRRGTQITYEGEEKLQMVPTALIRKKPKI